MPTLTFNFSGGLNRSGQEKLLKKIQSWQGVRAAARLDPEATDDVISRMAFAELDDGETAESIASRLAELPGVEHVEEPPRRGLIG
jgi:hypothetical protein